ncbi:hypothetical protein C8R47DRAFT_13261 [Mycena vitilis]|nr:hypothetical protein C8R47DRAFT_13261 [Mycena vitilis]
MSEPSVSIVVQQAWLVLQSHYLGHHYLEYAPRRERLDCPHSHPPGTRWHQRYPGPSDLVLRHSAAGEPHSSLRVRAACPDPPRHIGGKHRSKPMYVYLGTTTWEDFLNELTTTPTVHVHPLSAICTTRHCCHRSSKTASRRGRPYILIGLSNTAYSDTSRRVPARRLRAGLRPPLRPQVEEAASGVTYIVGFLCVDTNTHSNINCYRLLTNCCSS